ncbi:MAG: PadR family transcriptional regulator [Deltaproteobacteria bacterium]|nr:PadR family transcriptional regulator [Deltaproteobacteria bacterium]MBW1912202.1 PadR family transcriptional regulator [Deltaproteobacteria bacterium]
MLDRHRFDKRRSRHEKPFNKGDLKYIILDLINDKHRYGYEIIQVIQERSHGFYTPSPGTVYPTLQMLEEMGHISADQQDSKKVYSITDGGRKFLDKRKDFTKGIKNQMKDYWSPENANEMSETMDKFSRLWNLLRRQARTADAEKVRRIREVISRTSTEIEEILK